jgi:hypothetical protein
MKKHIIIIIGILVTFVSVQAQTVALKMTKHGYDGIMPQKVWKVSFPAEYDAVKYGSELEMARRDGNLYMVENANMGISIVFLDNKAVVLDYSATGTEYYFRGIAEYKNNEISAENVDFCDNGKSTDCEQKTKDIQSYIQNAYKHYTKEIEAHKLAQK